MLTGAATCTTEAPASSNCPAYGSAPTNLEALLVMDHLLESVQPGMLHEHMRPLREKVKDLPRPRASKAVPLFPTHRIRILRSHARPVSTAKLIARRRGQSSSGDNWLSSTPVAWRATPPNARRRRNASSTTATSGISDAWDEAKDALRTFAHRPAGRHPSPSRPRPRSSRLFAGPAKETARLRFTPERARWVADETWHPEQSGHYLADGTLRATRALRRRPGARGRDSAARPGGWKSSGLTRW